MLRAQCSSFLLLAAVLPAAAFSVSPAHGASRPLLRATVAPSRYGFAPQSVTKAPPPSKIAATFDTILDGTIRPAIPLVKRIFASAIALTQTQRFQIYVVYAALATAVGVWLRGVLQERADKKAEEKKKKKAEEDSKALVGFFGSALAASASLAWGLGEAVVGSGGKADEKEDGDEEVEYLDESAYEALSDEEKAQVVVEEVIVEEKVATKAKPKPKPKPKPTPKAKAKPKPKPKPRPKPKARGKSAPSSPGTGNRKPFRG